ncbi:MAG TPA: APC family permease [Blastocatellia bacterium]|nr:APC family permease [Blastocatellia bacterium]
MSRELKQAEAAVEAHSAELKKELGLFDLTLTQILFIVGLGWVGAAGKLGQSHVLLWLTAVVLFYIPTAAVVIYLNRLMPLEGGLYQWASLGFNRLIGFMVAWNLWLYVIALTSEIGLQVATNLSYAIGARAAWMATSKWFITLSGCAVMTLLVCATVFGLGLGKWIHNAGGILLMVVFAALIALPFIALARGELHSYHPLAVEIPAVSLLNLNILGKMGFAALGGFEYVAILAGECRSPARSVGLSVVISAPVITLMFILGTSSVVAFLKPDDINLIAPIPQVLSVGFHSFAFAARIVPIAILVLLGLRLAQASVNFTANSRLPMVAGWDRLLPEWFCRLHPKYKTPANSIIFVGAMTLAFGLAGILGVGEQEAYQLLQSASISFYALSYLVMLVIPLIGLRAAGIKPGIWIRLAAVSGFLMTFLNFALSIFPIVAVQSWFEFSLKVSGVIVAANSLGLLIFLFAERKREAGQVAAEVSMGN